MTVRVGGGSGNQRVERARESSGGGAVAEAAGVAGQPLEQPLSFFSRGVSGGAEGLFYFSEGSLRGVLSLAGVESLVWG